MNSFYFQHSSFILMLEYPKLNFLGLWQQGKFVSCQVRLGPVHTNPFSNEYAICSGYGYRPHYNAKNDHRKRSHSKTLSRVERFENDAYWKRCLLVWTEKTMLSENGDVIKIDTTGRQTTRPWVSKMADEPYHSPLQKREGTGASFLYWLDWKSKH